MVKFLMPAVTLVGDFSRLMINFANSLNQDQGQEIVSPDLDPNRLTLW